MLTILSFAGLAGFLGSVLLLKLGVDSMPVRYALAVLVAYGTFLVGVRVWLLRKQRRSPHAMHSWVDALDPGALTPNAPSEVSAAFEFGGGGRFSGGGAGGSLDLSETTGEGGSAVGEAVAGAAELEEGALFVVPLIIILALVAGLVGIGLLVSGAPVLLGEVLLDGLITGTAYRRLRESSPQHWMTGVIRRTWRSALALLLVLVGCGWLIQWLLPAARSIGDIVGR